MHFLPRSRRGTWLLGGAVWLAACYGLWRTLPVAPRVVLQLPEDSDWIGFGPEGASVLFRRRVDTTDAEQIRAGRQDECFGPALWALDLQELPSAQFAGTLLDRCEVLDVVGNSADASSWLIRTGSARFTVIDVSNLTVTTLAIPPSDAENYHSYGLSPNGRFALFRDDARGFAVVLWDVAHNRRHGILHGLTLMDRSSSELCGAAFSADSRSLVALVKDLRNCIRVIDVESLTTRASFDDPAPHGMLMLNSVHLNDDGSFVAADFYPPPPSNNWPVECWNIQTRKAMSFPAPLLRPRFADQGRVVIATDIFGEINGFDLATGVSRFTLTRRSFFTEVSPDGKILAVVIMESDSSPLFRFARRVGLSFLFASTDRKLTRLHNAANGDELGIVPGKVTHWAPGGRLLAVCEAGDKRRFEIWDIPPRKSLSWFTVGVALLGLPIAVVALWRVRRLRVG